MDSKLKTHQLVEHLRSHFFSHSVLQVSIEGMKATPKLSELFVMTQEIITDSFILLYRTNDKQHVICPRLPH